MGLFGKLFDKKVCDICGGEIGLLGNRKLEDGNLCKDCARKLSPWFSGRRHSTVEEIREQLAMRESNREQVTRFLSLIPSGAIQVFGMDTKIMINTVGKEFLVAETKSIQEENPDVIEAKYLVSCNTDIQHSREELKRKNDEGEMVSYYPPRYEYSYDFYVVIQLQGHPYVDEIRFQLNPDTVQIYSEAPRQGAFMTNMDDIHPELNPEYRKYDQMAEEICEAMRKLNAPSSYTQADEPAETPNVAPVENGPWTCPSCGGQNSGKFCEYCGTPRPR